MKVHRLVLDPNSNSPIVILQDEATGVLLPIWIGIFEAHSIAMKMEGIEAPRPLTHDLFSNTIETLNGVVERVEVVDLVDNTYFARIHLLLKDELYLLDSRPSDAIALALRLTSPIFVANHVLEHSKIDPEDFKISGEEEGEEGAESASGESSGEGDEDEYMRILKNFNPNPDKDKYN